MSDWRWELMPLTLTRGRIIHTDGLNIDRFY